MFQLCGGDAEQAAGSGGVRGHERILDGRHVRIRQPGLHRRAPGLHQLLHQQEDLPTGRL